MLCCMLHISGQVANTGGRRIMHAMSSRQQLCSCLYVSSGVERVFGGSEESVWSELLPVQQGADLKEAAAAPFG